MHHQLDAQRPQLARYRDSLWADRPAALLAAVCANLSAIPVTLARRVTAPVSEPLNRFTTSPICNGAKPGRQNCRVTVTACAATASTGARPARRRRNRRARWALSTTR